MAANEELVEAVAQAIHGAEVGWRSALGTNTPKRIMVARAVLAVPAIADALADVEVYWTALGLACSDGWSDGASAMQSYIETARDHIAALRAVDDSDIVPGSEFDGPVIL